MFAQRGGLKFAKFLDEESSNKQEIGLKEGWNELDMNGEFKNGFMFVYSEDTEDNIENITNIDLSKFTGTKIKTSMFCNISCKEAIMPDTIEEIEFNGFGSNEKLTTVHFSKNLKKIGTSGFTDCHSLEEINLPEGLEEIGDYAFSGVKCKNLILPSTIKKLGGVFYDLYNKGEEVISTVRFKSLEPPIITSYYVFYRIDRIEVPMTAVETYKNIDFPGWKENFGDKIVGY